MSLKVLRTPDRYWLESHANAIELLACQMDLQSWPKLNPFALNEKSLNKNDELSIWPKGCSLAFSSLKDQSKKRHEV